MTAVFFVALALAAAVIGLLVWSKIAWRIATDVPNERSLHALPIPRIGGWGVIPAAVVTAAAFGAWDWLLGALLAVLFVMSYIDDRVGLPIVVRLPVHAVAAAIWLAFGPIGLPLAVAALATFAIVWITNLFNFMDGADGLAGGMALFAFSAYAAVAAIAGVTPLATWAMAIAGAAAGFLFFNFNPARVFLGDAGSVTIGFLAGVFGIWGWAAGAWPFWFPFLVAAPFFLDATATVLRRMLKRERFWEAHREHYYQRLIRSGCSHRRTAILEYALMAGCGSLAIAMLQWSTAATYAGLAAAAAVFVLIAVTIDRRWKTHRARAPEAVGELDDRGTLEYTNAEPGTAPVPLAPAAAARLHGSVGARASAANVQHELEVVDR